MKSYYNSQITEGSVVDVEFIVLNLYDMRHILFLFEKVTVYDGH